MLHADDRLDRLLARIVPTLDPDAVYLFGSRARGEARPDSDYDLLVVVPDATPKDRLGPVAGFRLIHDTRIPADVFPCRRSGFERSRDLPGTLSFEAFHNGRLVYAK